MRVDRAVTLFAFRAIGSSAPSRAATRLPVLMYHSISATVEQATPYFRTSTHPAVFEEQMRLLEQDGYTGVTLTEALNSVRFPNSQASSRQPVAITFDDGYRDFLTTAVPVMQKHGFKATMYLPTGFIGRQRSQFKNRDCLTWNEVSKLHDLGFEFGSHTVTHPYLVDLAWDDIQTELISSKQTIEKQLSQEVTTFSYPYAFPQSRRRFLKQFTELLKSTGYSSAVTTIIGRVDTNDDTLRLKRLPVNSCDDSELLRAKLKGFYNWMGAAQSVAKYLKRR